MGIVQVTVTIRNPAEPDRSWDGLFRVDAGSTDCVAPGTHSQAGKEAVEWAYSAPGHPYGVRPGPGRSSRTRRKLAKRGMPLTVVPVYL